MRIRILAVFFTVSLACWGVIAFVQAALHSIPSSSADATVTIAGVTAGNALIVGIAASQGGGAVSPFGSTCSDDHSGTYTQAVNAANGTATSLGSAIYYRMNVPASATYVITCTGVVANPSFTTTYALEASGLASLSPVDTSASNPNTGSGPYNGGSLVTTNANDLLIAVLATTYAGANLGVLAGTGFTIPTNGVNNNGGASGTAGGIEYKVVSASGTYNTPFTLNNASPSGAGVAVAFKAAAGATPAIVRHRIISQ